MTNEQLAALLAERVMGWGTGPERFMMRGRRWLPRWRFSPVTRLEDAFLLLNHAGGAYTLVVDPNGLFTAEVRIRGQVGKATGDAKGRTITLAIARALNLEAVGVVKQQRQSNRQERQR